MDMRKDLYWGVKGTSSVLLPVWVAVGIGSELSDVLRLRVFLSFEVSMNCNFLGPERQNESYTMHAN